MNKIKRFCYNIAGWKVDDTLFQSEIFLPETREYVVEQKSVYEPSLSGHKITVKNEPQNKFVQLLHTTQQKAHEITPKRQELDAFRLKAITVLQNHESLTSLSYKELIALVQRYPIEIESIVGDFGYGITAIELTQKLSDFPGETLEIRQMFQRDPFHPELCFPVKESFTMHTRCSQTGFPHPVQYIGFTFHEKLLPSFTRHPRKLIKLSKLLEKKQTLSRKLLPQGVLFTDAKKHLQMKRKIFNKNVELLILLEKMVQRICLQVSNTKSITDFFALARQKPYPFDFISYVHDEVMQKMIQEPIEEIQDEWLLKNNRDLYNHDFFKEMLEGKMCKAVSSMSLHENPVVSTYQVVLGQNFKNCVLNISLMLFSEHLHFAPPTLSSFDKMVLASMFRSLLLFIYELEEYPQELQTEKHMTLLLEEECALFSQKNLIDEHSKLAFELVDELLQYFST